MLIDNSQDNSDFDAAGGSIVPHGSVGNNSVLSPFRGADEFA
jgi:hypothetical protein